MTTSWFADWGCACEATTTTVVAAGDAYAAITSTQKERPDLIILDLGLPAGDGFVVLDRLNKLGYLSTVPSSC
jgi:CheY-like chemotaxis protein